MTKGTVYKRLGRTNVQTEQSVPVAWCEPSVETIKEVLDGARDELLKLACYRCGFICTGKPDPNDDKCIYNKIIELFGDEK